MEGYSRESRQESIRDTHLISITKKSEGFNLLCSIKPHVPQEQKPKGHKVLSLCVCIFQWCQLNASFCFSASTTFSRKYFHKCSPNSGLTFTSQLNSVSLHITRIWTNSQFYREKEEKKKKAQIKFTASNSGGSLKGESIFKCWPREICSLLRWAWIGWTHSRHKDSW